jgi:uncharacterized membrane protein YukC
MPTPEDSQRCYAVASSKGAIEHLLNLSKLIDLKLTPPKLVADAKKEFRLVVTGVSMLYVEDGPEAANKTKAANPEDKKADKDKAEKEQADKDKAEKKRKKRERKAEKA